MADLKWRGDEAEKLIWEVALEAMNTGAEAILTEAIDETPIDTGTLRRSGGVSWGIDRKSVYVSFNTPYARRQHEDLTLRHPRGGGPKYLENPFKRNEGKVRRLVGLRVKQALQSKRQQ